MTFQPASVLFDKGVIRRVYEYNVRLARGISPTPSQLEAIEVFGRLCLLSRQRYITEQTANVLQRRSQRFTQVILKDTQILRKGRYLRRWARRLRSLAFSPEDAVMLAFASFGVGADRFPIGIEAVVTNDFKLAANFDAQHSQIQARFDEMIFNLTEPYAGLKLPAVMTTVAVLMVT